MKAFASVINMSDVSISAGDSANVHMCAHFLPSKIIFWGCRHMVSNSWNSYSGRRHSSGIPGTKLAPVKSESQEHIEHSTGQEILILCALLPPYL